MTATVAERITQTKSDKPMLNNNGDGCRKTGIAVMKESDPKTLLHPAWLAFVRYCAELRHGEIGLLKIQDGLPILAEVTKKKVKFVP